MMLSTCIQVSGVSTLLMFFFYFLKAKRILFMRLSKFRLYHQTDGQGAEEETGMGSLINAFECVD